MYADDNLCECTLIQAIFSSRKKKSFVFAKNWPPTDYFRETKGMRVGEGTQVGDAAGWGVFGGRG